MQYCDEQAFLALINAVKARALAGDEDAVEDLDTVKGAVLACANYCYRVNEEQIEASLARGVKKGEELRALLGLFDEKRHQAHEKAIVNARILNRMAALYGAGPVYLGDPEKRREIGSFCGELCGWIFEHRSD